MPFLDVSLRQALGLVTSCPSAEDITQAAAKHGWHWDPVSHQLTPAQPPVATAKKAPRAKAAASAEVLVEPAGEAIPADS